MNLWTGQEALHHRAELLELACKGGEPQNYLGRGAMTINFGVQMVQMGGLPLQRSTPSSKMIPIMTVLEIFWSMDLE